MPGAGGSARVPTVELLQLAEAEAEADGEPGGEAEEEGPAVGLGVAVGVGVGVGVGLGLAESLGVASVAEAGKVTAPIPRPRLTTREQTVMPTAKRPVVICTGSHFSACVANRQFFRKVKDL
jgi:hypothetical protein